MSSITAAQNQAERVAGGRIWWVGLLAIVTSAIVNILIFYVASAMGVGFVLPPEMGGAVGTGMVVISTAIGIIGASVVYTIVGRFARRPIQLYRIVASVVLLLSFANPFLVPTFNLTTGLVLCAMHIVAAVVSVGLLTSLAREQ